MDENIRQEKLKMWKEKLLELQNDYSVCMQKRAAAAAEGDLSENAAYEMLTEQAQVISAQMNNVQKILASLEKK
jgi:hypothetical protein